MIIIKLKFQSMTYIYSSLLHYHLMRVIQVDLSELHSLGVEVCYV